MTAMTRIAVSLLLALGLLAGLFNHRSSAAAPPASRGTLVFTANVSGNWDLWMLPPERTTPIQLTKTPLDERTPAISPDGRQIAYITSDGSLWLLQVGTNQPQQLGGPPGHYGYPTWMPDGDGLVYTSYTFNPPSEDAEVFRYSVKERKQQLLLQQTGPQDFSAVSPLGDRIAYVSSVATLVPRLGATVTQQLWTASLREGRARQLFFGSARETRPAWSPDGQRIAFSSDRGGNTDIWITDADGREAPAALTSGPGSKTSPAWSPDGLEIAYVSTASQRSALMVSDVATKRARAWPLFSSASVETRDPAWR